jgi:hypothetical protein
VAAFAFGVGGATFFAVLRATYLRLRPGQTGTSQAVVSTFGLVGVGFPALVGVVSNTIGLTAGLGLYAAVPVAVRWSWPSARRRWRLHDLRRHSMSPWRPARDGSGAEW